MIVMIRIAIAALGIAVVGASVHHAQGDKNKPHTIPAAEAGIGGAMPRLIGKSIDDRNVNVANLSGGKPLVIALTSTTCPLARKFAPTLAALEDAYLKKGVKFLYLNPEEGLKPADLRGAAQAQGFEGHYVNDPSWIATLDAKSTTEVYVYDGARRLVYRGAVDDQYGIGYSLNAPKTRYLANALDAVLKGEKPNPEATWAPGCVLESLSAEDMAVTYHANIAPIIQQKCLPCHREGGVGPFKLDSYDAVKGKAAMIKYSVDKGIMPPWFAKEDGPTVFKNNVSLTQEEKDRLFAWIEAGTPAGDPSASPKPPVFEKGWNAGKPDHIVRIPEPIKVKATGVMAYKNLVVPTGLAEDKWIQAMEVRPTARQVVHHVLIFVREKGRETFGNPGEEINGFFAAYVPGTDHIIYPEGFAKKLPGGASLRFQIHYTPNGEATEDQIELGLHFADKPVKHEVQTAGIANVFLDIPPGASRHPIESQIPVPFDAKILSLIPHMHVRGTAAKFVMTTPAGKTQTLLDVPRYDFNWQLNYEFKEPVDAPKGSRIKFTAWYDNSDKNPANPDPSKRVRWGDQTFDEMHLGYVEYFVPSLKPGEKPAGAARPGGGALVKTIFQGLDKDADGFVTEAEAGRAWDRIKAADADKDGKVSLEEAMKLFGG